jgi:hypothetical protein
MTADIGSRKSIGRQFIPRPVDLLKSPAYRVLNIHEHRVLTRIEIEHAAHAGKDNGRLPVTYNDFERHGVSRKYIAPAIAALTALGLVEVTQRGRANNGEFRAPSLYRLTYLHTEQADPTNEWADIGTMAQAEEIVRSLRRREPRARPRPPTRTAASHLIVGRRVVDGGRT